RKVCSGFRKRSCSKKKLERDDDSKKSHHALSCRRASRCTGAWADEIQRLIRDGAMTRPPHSLAAGRSRSLRITSGNDKAGWERCPNLKPALSKARQSAR